VNKLQVLAGSAGAEMIPHRRPALEIDSHPIENETIARRTTGIETMI